MITNNFRVHTPVAWFNSVESSGNRLSRYQHKRRAAYLKQSMIRDEEEKLQGKGKKAPFVYVKKKIK